MGHPTIAAVTHKDADGDTLGSALALAQALEPLGKSVPVLSSPPVPTAWDFLPGIERVNRDPVERRRSRFPFRLPANPGRAGQFSSMVVAARTVVNIDHHVTNTRFGDVQPRLHRCGVHWGAGL